MKSFKKITIIGIGLIGGSIALDLKRLKKCEEIVGIARREKTLNEALQRGLIDTATTDVERGIKDADLIILATPIEAIIDFVQILKEKADKSSIIMDVGSTKTQICQIFDRYFSQGPFFVGAHPLAGSHESGPAFAVNGLFKDCVCVLTPTKNTNQVALSKVREIWKDLGSKVIEISPQQHDLILGVTSHFPHLLASCLVELAGKSLTKQQLSLFAATGFKDTTRIAASSPELWRDIFLTNKEKLLDLISDYKQILTEWEELLKSSDRKSICEKFEKSSKLRKQI